MEGPAQKSDRRARRTANPRRLAKAAFRIAVAAGLLSYLFSKIPVSRAMEALVQIETHQVAATFASALAMQCVISQRLRLIADGQGICVSLFRALDINLSAMFYGLFVPGGNLSKGAIRAYKLYRRSGRLMAAAAATIFDRLVATVALSAR